MLTALLFSLKLVLLILWSLPHAPQTSALVPSCRHCPDECASHALGVASRTPTGIATLHPICLYLLITILVDIAQTRTLWLVNPTSYALAVVYSVALAAKALLFVVEASEKRKYLISGYESLSTESKSRILSRSISWWLNGLLFQGLRESLFLADLFPLDKSLASKPLTTHFERRWKKGCIITRKPQA